MLLESIKKFRGDFKNVFSGFAIGVANVIPGISGGTMAFLLGVFEPLVKAIGDIASSEMLKLVISRQWKQIATRVPWRFLLTLGAGVFIALGTVTRLVLYCLNNHPSLTYAFFFGLMVASIFCVHKKVGRWNAANIIALLIGAVVAFFVVTLSPSTLPDTWYVQLFCGAIAVCAMILPGISGSFLLLVLGQYQTLWQAVGSLARLQITWSHLSVAFWFGIGGVAGIGAFSHLLNFLFKRFRDGTTAVLIGFMVGSMYKLWPWQVVTQSLSQKADVTRNVCPAIDAMFWGAILCFALGIALVWLSEKMAVGKGDGGE